MFSTATTVATPDATEEVMLIDPHRDWLVARGFTDATITKFNLHTHSDGQAQWLRVPYLEDGQTINHKWRKTKAKQHRMDKDAPLLLWNHAALVEAAKTKGTLVITEGEWDAMAVDQSGCRLVVSVPNGAASEASDDVFSAQRYSWFLRHQALLDQIPKFILATDDDLAGRVLAADLARLLGPERCMFVEYPAGHKDLNEVLLVYGESDVEFLLKRAKPYPVVGLYSMGDFPEPPPFLSTPIGIEGLEDLWPLTPGTFSVVTGWPGHGKSSLVLCAVANLLKDGVPVALGSFETMVKPVLQRRLRACMYQCDENDPRAKQRGQADDVMDEKLRIISNLHANDDTELSIEAIIELAIVAVLRDGIRLLILDPWNEIEHKRGRDESETEYVGRAIRLLKRFGRDYHCAVWVVAHPRKPSTDGAPRRPSLLDLAGSANFANKADYGVIVHRPDLGNDVAEAIVTKKRMGLPGAMGKVSLSWRNNISRYEQVYL
jgi:twinkle protein